MPWLEDEDTGEEWYQGNRLAAALSEMDAAAVVYVEVEFDELEGYGDAEPGPGSMSFFSHGIRAGNLAEQIGDFGSARGYFSSQAVESGRAARAEGVTGYRLFTLEGYVPHLDTHGKRH